MVLRLIISCYRLSFFKPEIEHIYNSGPLHLNMTTFNSRVYEKSLNIIFRNFTITFTRRLLVTHHQSVIHAVTLRQVSHGCVRIFMQDVLPAAAEVGQPAKDNNCALLHRHH